MPKLAAVIPATEAAHLDDHIAVRVVRASEALTRIASRSIEARWGLRNTDLRVLNVLDGAAPVTIAEISRRTHVDKAWISRTVRELESRDLVSRSADPRDTRLALVALTARGRDLLEEVRPHALKNEARLLAGIDSGLLKSLLERLEANATEILERG